MFFLYVRQDAALSGSSSCSCGITSSSRHPSDRLVCPLVQPTGSELQPSGRSLIHSQSTAEHPCESSSEREPAPLRSAGRQSAESCLAPTASLLDLGRHLLLPDRRRIDAREVQQRRRERSIDLASAPNRSLLKIQTAIMYFLSCSKL